MFTHFRYSLFGVLLVVLSSVAMSAEDVPKIADEPEVIDLATLVHQSLAKKVTVDLTDKKLEHLFDWLREAQDLPVLVDRRAFDAIGFNTWMSISDRLEDAPIYLLLDRRRRARGLDWYVHDDVLHITTTEDGEEHEIVTPHPIGDLLDQGYTKDGLIELIQLTVEPTSWPLHTGPGPISSSGRSLLVRRCPRINREIHALLTALRTPGRQTFVCEPLEHVRIREQLERPTSVDFSKTPLIDAITQLDEALPIDIRLDPAGFNLHDTVTLTLTDRKLKTTLDAMLPDLEMDWMLRDGVLWITPKQWFDGITTAVYDVRDLCRDLPDTRALIAVIRSEVQPMSWGRLGGPGTITSAHPGILAIRQSNRAHMEVFELLEACRAQLKKHGRAKPRDADKPEDVVTVYYRLHEHVAKGLMTVIPQVVQPDSWQNATQTDAPGQIILAPAGAEATSTVNRKGEAKSNELPSTPMSVLIIRQTRAAHQEIDEMLHLIQHGGEVGDSDEYLRYQGYGEHGFF